MSEVVVIANLYAKPGRGADLVALLSDLAGKVIRTEPETLRYAFFAEPASDPLHVVVVEKYASAAGAEAHNTGVLADYIANLLDLLDRDPETVELQPLSLTVDEADSRLSI